MEILKKQFKTRQDIPCLVFNKTKSTNEDAKIASIPEGVIIAREQTNGKGRYDRNFLSLKNKGAYFSYFFYGDVEKINLYSAVSSIAVMKYLLKLGVDCKIKWPNDILVNGKKICGILPISTEIDGKRRIVIGIGLNLNYKENDYTEELKSKATSLFIEKGIKKNPIKVALEIVRVLKELLKCDKDELLKIYRNNLCYVGKKLQNSEGKKCKMIGVDNDFSLQVIFDNENDITTINWGEMSFIESNNY